MAAAKKSKGVQYHLVIPFTLIGILLILLFPLPTPILDVGIAISIVISLVILFVCLYIEKPLQFSAFPAILLVTTLFRLSLSIATTRLILLHGGDGTDAAGDVIKAFGEYVVGGNYVIGFVMFVAISMVNLKVVTKGAGRIAEVAARFTLDALPGKQMAIDSDMNIGMISEKEAKQRRKDLAMESEFYGAMDGASKFVSGDAQAGVILLGINSIGGLLVGVVQHKMGWLEALQTYTLLTVGDGLVTQIPAIIVSVGSGLIVARAASGDDLGSEIIDQLSQSTRPLYLTSGVCLGLAIMPGLPFMPFVILSAISGAMALSKTRSAKRDMVLVEQELKVAAEPAGPKPGSTEEVTALLGIDTLELEVGYELVSVVEHGDLVERIRSIRRQFALDYGFIVPPIHIRDNVRIKSAEYRFLLKGASIGSGMLRSHHLLAMDPGTVTSPLSGIPTKEPAFGLDAIWITEPDKERAQFSGYTVVDLSTVITTHLTEMVRSNMHELLGRQEVQHLLDQIARNSPKVVEELVPGVLTLGQVQQVLGNLLREQISIRDLKTILETLADWAPHMKHPEKLSDFVRRKFARSITAKFTTPDGILPLASLTPHLERVLSEALQQTDEGSFLAVEPGVAQQLIGRLTRIGEKFGEMGQTPLLLAPAHLRAALFHFVERFVPGYSVISHHEIAPNTKVQSLGVLSLEEA